MNHKRVERIWKREGVLLLFLPAEHFHLLAYICGTPSQDGLRLNTVGRL